MTIKEILNHAGVGGAGGVKAAFDRYQHGAHTYYGGTSGGSGHGGYNYPAPSYHGSPHVIKHYSYTHSDGGGKGGGNKGGGAALSALTLLSFLFFLNILQQCLRDQMAATTPQVMVMTSGREDIDKMAKTAEDKEGKSASSKSTVRGYDMSDGIGRAYPAEATEKLLNDSTEEDSEDEGFPTDIHAPKFVNAMGEGVGEVINEQK